MYEVWVNKGRDRKLIARFRLLRDAQHFIANYGGEGELELNADDTSPDSIPHSTPPEGSTPPGTPPPGTPPHGRPPQGPPSAPRSGPSSIRGRRRRTSGIQGAIEHDDEFIADGTSDD